MARLPRRWGTTKPPPGGSVNWGHPLADRLISAVPFAEGAGRPIDWAQAKTLGPGTLAFPSSGWVNTALGPGIKYVKNVGEGIQIGLGGVIQPTDGLTLVSWYSLANAAEENCATLSAGSSATTTALHMSWSNSFHGPYGTWYNGSSPDRPNAAVTWPADPSRMFMQAFVHRPNGSGAGRLFLNGKLLAVGSSGINGGALPSTPWYIGIDALNTGEAFEGVIVETLIYRRGLSDAEIAWLYAEPFAWAMPPSPRLFTAGLSLPSSSAIKTVDGLAKASVKTVDGLAIASVKTIDGLT